MVHNRSYVPYRSSSQFMSLSKSILVHSESILGLFDPFYTGKTIQQGIVSTLVYSFINHG